MATSNISKQSGAWKFRTFITKPRTLLRIFRDKRTPWIAKVLPFLALLYVISPLDFIPDFIPIIGQIDDVTVVLFLLSMALDHVPDVVFASAGITFPKVHDVE